jgi:predicted deacetylase
MTAKYLIRLDDACSTMPQNKWDILESFFETHNIKPLVAVIPDNQDKSMRYEDEDEMFWSRIRRWQSKDWSIAMHGYQHTMHYTDAKLILPFYKRSEFAGLDYKNQADKIKKSWSIFQHQKVQPVAWIAPAHSFDEITISAVKKETSIKIISDGFAKNPFYLHSIYWIPQQLWDYEYKKTGTWTICLHPNSMSLAALERFKKIVEANLLDKVCSLNEIQLTKRRPDFFDRLFSFKFWSRYKFFKALSILRS